MLLKIRYSFYSMTFNDNDKKEVSYLFLTKITKMICNLEKKYCDVL